VDTTPGGELIEPPRDDDDRPAAEASRAAESGPVIDVAPISGMVRLDPDETVDAEPLAGLIVNEMEMAEEEAAVIEPVALADHGLGSYTTDAEPAATSHDPIEPEPVELNGDGSDHEAIEVGSATSVAEPEVDSADLTADSDPDSAQSAADDAEPVSDGAPVLWLDFGDSDADSDADNEDEDEDEDEEAEALGALSVDAPAIDVDGEADPEEIAFLAPTTSDVAIDTMRLIGAGDHLDGSTDEPAVSEAALSAAEEPANDTDLPVIATTILDQLSSRSGGFAQHLVATFLKDAPHRIGELPLR
jgi:hypothetical protein